MLRFRRSAVLTMLAAPGFRAMRRLSTAPLHATLLAVSLIAGCGGSPEGPAVGMSDPSKLRRKPPAPIEDGPLPYLPSHPVAALDEDTGYAAFARDDAGRGMLVFAQGGAWRARPLDARGEPLGPIVEIAKVTGRATHLTVRPAPGGGFLAAWDVAMDANHAMWVAALDDAGRPRAPASAALQVADRVTFADLVCGEGGSYLLHEIGGQGVGGTAKRVVVTPIDPRRGGATGPSTVVAADALGWQMIPTRTGAALARVVAGAPGAKAEAAPAGAPTLGRVEVALIDARGGVGLPVVLTPRPTAQIDVELGVVGDRVVVAWTDAADAEGGVSIATLDAAGKAATKPVRVSPPAADAALVGLWAPARGGAGRALLAWETSREAPDPDGERAFTLVLVDPSGNVGDARATLPFVGLGRPDIVADGDGFAALVLAKIRLAREPDQGDPPIWPAFVRIGPDLASRGSEPLRATPFDATEGIPDLAFGLACSAGGCLAIGGAAGAPAPLASMELPVRESPYRTVLAEAKSAGATVHAAQAATLWNGERVADVAATKLDGGEELTAWVTWFAPGVTEAPPPPKGEKPFAATLGVALASGSPESAITISRRAMSQGGVSLAPIPAKKGSEAVVGWVASDDGVPQVFTTKVDAAGKKLAQKKVTVIDRGKKGAKDGRPTSECSSVDVAYAPQAGEGRPGVVVTWIDTRDGDAEVYAARLNTNLEKVGADRRVTTTKGEATEVRVAVRGAETFLAFIEARELPGNGDVYVTRLRTGNLEPIGEPARVFASAGATHGVRFAEGPGGRLFLTWVDDAARDSRTGVVDASSAAGGLRVVELDGAARPIGAPRRIEGVGPSVLDAAMGCGSGACRGLASVPGAPSRLLGFDEGDITGAREVGTALGGSAPLAPIGLDGAAFVVGDDDGRRGRVRVLRLGR